MTRSFDTLRQAAQDAVRYHDAGFCIDEGITAEQAIETLRAVLAANGEVDRLLTTKGSIMTRSFTRTWWLSMLERAGKTFGQFYLGFWMMTAGLIDHSRVIQNPGSAYDALFTWDNVKAGIVGLALSVATSLASTPVGPDESPSLVVTEAAPPAKVTEAPG